MRNLGPTPRHLMTLRGAVTLVRRRWHCAACATTVVPADQAWAVPPRGGATWEVRAVAAEVAAQVPSFAHAAALVHRLTPIHCSPRTVETYAEAIGDAYTLPTPSAQEAGPPADLVVVQLDGGHVHFRQDGWREVKVAAVYRTHAGEESPVRYAAVQGPWAAHADVVRALARREGSRHAQQLLCLADGDRPTWRLLTTLFPRAVQLLDWYHLQQHLGEVASLLPEGAAWLAAQQTALWTRGPRATLRALGALCRDAARPEAVRTRARQCLGYVWQNRHRMDYAAAHRRGWPCGSGRIESAIKQVVQARLKGPGMRWDHGHAQAMLNLRSAWLSGDLALACGQAQALALADRPAPPRSSGPLWHPRLPRHAQTEPPRLPTRRVATPRPPELTTREAAAIVKEAVLRL